MKRKFDHSAPAQRDLSGPKYWRSLDELADTPGFREHLAREFPEGASELNGVDRRQFMRLMAASFALGGLGLAGCRRPEKHILPYGKSVEYTVPGLPLYFATAMPLRKSAIPLVAETHQGRPTKLEGNPSYAPHGGASSLLAQASVLDLYDPERATTHTAAGRTLKVADVNDLLARIRATYAGNGEGLAFLADESSSPTRARLIAKLKKEFPRAIWSEYEPVQDEPPVAAAQAAFGRNVKPVYRFAKAKRIVSLDADFFHAEAGALYYSRDFAKGRRVATKEDADKMNRLYVAESGFSLTGSMADHRLRLASNHMLALAAALAGKALNTSAYESLAKGLDINPAWVEQCAADLVAHKGECLVVAGAHQPAQVHVLAYAINAGLGNIGKTIDFVAVEPAGASTITALATAIKGGAVKTLFILNGNPAYNAPADLDFGALLKSVPEVIRYGYYQDETSALSGTHLAATHYLESWGDARTVDGTIVPVQPMIMPLFNGLNEVELLARLAGEAKPDAYEQVFATRGGDRKAFEKFLHDGLAEGSAYPAVSVSFDSARAGAAFASNPAFVALSRDNLEIRFATDHKMDDGRFANNGWLQECPDPMTKIAWDNAILVSPRLAKDLGIVPGGSLLQVARKEVAEFKMGKENAFIGEVTVNGRKVTGPLHIQPGLSNYTIVLPLGYGRSVTGHVGTGAGFNAYAVRTSDGMGFITGAAIRVTAERQLLANTQEHWSMEGRDIVREANVEEFKSNPAFVDGIGMESHSPAILGADKDKPLAFIATETPRGNSLYETPNFDGMHQWGMSIDLNTCIGCNACIIACQAENNIPIVGRDQVQRGREMQWIRLDRYYSDGRADAEAFGAEGNTVLPEDPQVSMQPMTCQHCELAPCETVCPVNATVHDDEGINTMAYNRCIGTRYCANNCPYKVRRFNFFDFNKRATDALYMGPLGHQKEMPELVKMVKNPDVTVRMRGVMEKCTYCVQRIQQAKIAQKRKAGATGDVLIPDGSFKVACQQVCPVEAIEFGNIKDEASKVSQLKAQERDYAVLGYLNVRPRTTYLGKLRNPNPHMPDYSALPLSRVEYNQKNGHADHGAPAAHADHGHTDGGKH
ncbi:Tetrathionate reductase subunit B precursor [Lacunisphaera limnophila]|uniref:Tetrathionate reductase subunit B n=1 Tax=Lacunisphaera limnophila TaxID=1838286 RepID=A0A1D8AVU4_9BACT|nr:TAT-variant-translocated molybdopterin oxidoreductase [Lacunisphaera limnophila]AOS45012.1 Tetrathionate reductase subunit B precursor [Lacunisphaera limnophila]